MGIFSVYIFPCQGRIYPIIFFTYPFDAGSFGDGGPGVQIKIAEKSA